MVVVEADPVPCLLHGLPVVVRKIVAVDQMLAVAVVPMSLGQMRLRVVHALVRSQVVPEIVVKLVDPLLRVVADVQLVVVKLVVLRFAKLAVDVVVNVVKVVRLIQCFGSLVVVVVVLLLADEVHGLLTVVL